jgi:hypothetical protein
MRAVLVAALVSAAWSVPLDARAPQSAPEILNVTAQATGAVATATAAFDIQVDRYTPEAERVAVASALKSGGYAVFLNALQRAPVVGHVAIGTQKVAIRWARETVKGDRRSLVFVTDAPIAYIGSAKGDPKPRAGYNVALIQIDMDAAGSGTGTLAAAARVRPDGQGGVLLDDYAEQPIKLTSVLRKGRGADRDR